MSISRKRENEDVKCREEKKESEIFDRRRELFQNRLTPMRKKMRKKEGKERRSILSLPYLKRSKNQECHVL